MAEISRTAAVRILSYPDLEDLSETAAYLLMMEEAASWPSPAEGKNDMVVKIF